jgi:hypothetical protein
MEDLGHDLRSLRVRNQAALGFAIPRARGDGVRGAVQTVPVGWAAAAAEALQRVLAHAALGLARELLALVLVERLLQRDHQPALRGRRVARPDRIVDLSAHLAQLAVEQPRRHAVTGEARGLVDHHRVEAAPLAVTGLLRQRGPPGAVVLRARLLVEELHHDLPARLRGLALAGLELGRARQGLVLPVVGREAAVEGEPRCRRHRRGPEPSFTCASARTFSDRRSRSALA